MKENNSDSTRKIKLFLLGDSSVGKTSFAYKYVKNIFRDEHLATIGYQNLIKNITLKSGENLKIIFYDTAGQEKFKAIAYNLIKSANGIILMYDITNRKSFNSIPEWINDIIENKGINFPIVLIGNKCDLEEQRQVETDEGKELAEIYEFCFYEASSKEGINVEESILKLASAAFELKKNKGNFDEESQRNFKLKIEKKSEKSEKSEKKEKCKC